MAMATAPEIDDTTLLDLMELLDESPCIEEEEDDRLGRVIQSLEAEIATTTGVGSATADDGARVHVVPSGLDGPFDWMEVEPAAAAATESDAVMYSWYFEADDQFMVLLEYNSFCCYNGEESIEQVEYGSLWE